MKKKIWAVALTVCMMFSFLPSTELMAVSLEGDFIFDEDTETVIGYESEDTKISDMENSIEGVGESVFQNSRVSDETDTHSDEETVVRVKEISIDHTVFSMNTGEQEKLTATVLPEDATNREVTWESSNETVATVSTDGVVLAVGTGEATITTTADGKSTVCEVTVITLASQDDLEADIATESIIKNTNDDDLESSDAAGGSVKGEGSASQNSEVSDELDMDNDGESVRVEEILIDYTALSLDVGDQRKLTASVSPKNAANRKLVWTSNNEAVVTVDTDGVLTGIGAGETTITVMVDGESVVCEVVVNEKTFQNDFEFDAGRGTITKYIGEGGDLEIPAMIDGMAVTSIDPHAFAGCSELTSVVIPDSVTWVGYCAFKGCSGLTSVMIPDSVTSIGTGAFDHCSGLTSITIPKDLTFIADSMFDYCSGLTSVMIPDGVMGIGKGAFGYCSGLTSIIIPDSVTSIGWAAFEYSGLESITIPSSVTNIDGYVFKGCSGLKSVMIPDGMTGIGWGAFEDCSNLMNVTLPNSVTNIDGYAFSNCSSLRSATIPYGVTSIGVGAFGCCSGLMNVMIPDSVISIGKEAFYGCSSLTNITIPNSVTSIEQEVFYDCSGLMSITIPENVMSIGARAFYGCSNLTSMLLPENLTSIGISAFGNCKGLKSIRMSDSVISIGTSALIGCSGLECIYYGGTEEQWVSVAQNSGVPSRTVVYCTVRVEDISVNFDWLRLEIGDTAVLAAAVTPDNATYKEVTWESSDMEVAQVGADGTVTAVGIGEATITATTDGNRKSATCKVTVEIPVTEVKLDTVNATIVKGKTRQLTAIISPDDATNKSVMWSSSNANVATVSSGGLVTAKGAGTATITAETEDGSRSAFCKVTVTIPVTNVKLSASSASIAKGKTQQLTATVLPSNATNKAVTWSSSNTGVVAVSSSGLVTARGAGTATITVKTKDGSKSATCKMTVTIPVTKMVLSKTAMTLETGKTLTLKATVVPSNATSKVVTWKSNNTKIATVSTKGIVTAKGPGTATITASADGKSASCKITVQPVKPSGVKAVPASYNSIKVSWNKVTGASGYEIYRATSKDGKYSKSDTVTKGTTVTYTDNKALTGTVYYYKIRAYTISGQSKIYSAYSGIVSAKAALSLPVVMAKKASSISVKVSWKQISGANGYQVQMSMKKTSGFATKATIKKGSTISSTVTELQKGKTYYFRVRAYRTVNGKNVYSGWSVVKSITIQ